MNKPDTVSEVLRLRVRAAIERLNYVPDSAARSLSMRRTQVISAVVPTLDYSIFARFLEALQHRAGEVGYSVVLSTNGFDPERELEQARALIGHGVEALMLSGEQHSPELHRFLTSRNIPYVHTDVYSPDSHHPCVGYDNRSAAKQVVAHLLNLGHRDIAALVGPRATNDRMALRIAGARVGLEERGLELSEGRIVERPYSIAKARDGFRELMRREPEVTAIVCGNDVLAFGVILEAQAMGIKVPQDLSVVGFDNLEFAAEINPPLTTIQVPTYDMGIAAADYLIGQLTGVPVATHTKIEINFILRGSTGPAPVR